MNLTEFKILSTDAPVSTGRDAFKSTINLDRIVAVQPNGENKTTLWLDAPGELKKVEVEGGYEETVSKIE